MRTPAMLLAGGCLALLTVAACGARTTSAGQLDVGHSTSVVDSVPPAATTVPTTTVPTTNKGVPPPADGTTFVPAPIAPGDATLVPAARVRTMGMAEPPKDVRTQGRHVLFTYGQAGCEHVVAQVTTQTAGAVTIQVQTLVSSRGGVMCPMIVRAVPLEVTLSAPLGSRTIIFQHLLSHRS